MRCANRGYTLLEILVAVAISAMVVLSVSVAIRTFVSSLELHKRKSKEEIATSLFFLTFFRWLQNLNMKPFGVSLPFSGDSSEIKFASEFPLTGRYFPGVFGVLLKADRSVVLEADVPLIDAEDVREFKEGRADMAYKRVFSCANGDADFSYYNGRNWVDSWRGGKLPEYVGLRCGGELVLLLPVAYFK